MWLVDNETFNRLLDGDYTLAIDLKKRDKDLTIMELFCFQLEYKSYDGFRKFYNKVLSKIINHVVFIDESSLVGKLLKFLLRK